MNRQSLGSWGEAAAADYLVVKGYRLLERNFRTPDGEIDLIAMDGEILVFVEVKTRSNTRYGLPEVSVTTKKMEHLQRAVQHYLIAHPDATQECRVDVIAILTSRDRAPEITHFINVSG